MTSSIVNAPYKLTSSEAKPCLSFATISVALSRALGPPEDIDVCMVVFIRLVAELWPKPPKLLLYGWGAGGLLKPTASGCLGAAGLWKDWAAALAGAGCPIGLGTGLGVAMGGDGRGAKLYAANGFGAPPLPPVLICYVAGCTGLAWAGAPPWKLAAAAGGPLGLFDRIIFFNYYFII